MANFTDRKDILSAISNIYWWRKQIKNGRNDPQALKKFAKWWNYIEDERRAAGLRPYAGKKLNIPLPEPETATRHLRTWGASEPESEPEPEPETTMQVTRTYFVSSVEAGPPTDWKPEPLQWL